MSIKYRRATAELQQYTSISLVYSHECTVCSGALQVSPRWYSRYKPSPPYAELHCQDLHTWDRLQPQQW